MYLLFIVIIFNRNVCFSYIFFVQSAYNKSVVKRGHPEVDLFKNSSYLLFGSKIKI